MDEPSFPSRSPAVVLTEERRDRHVLHCVEGELAHVLNETARAIWDLCDGFTSPGEMVEGMVVLFGEPRDSVARDVERVLADLSAAGLLTWHSSAAAPQHGREGRD